jgi:O-antigen/teichoic acid export membrane protein
MMNVGRLLVSTAVGFILPSFLIHRLPVTTYSAWVLILQISAYVSYLDFGIQNGVSKYVAEYEARADRHGSSSRASAGLLLLLVVSLVGVVLTLLAAWKAPQLFHSMPPSVYHDVRLGLLLVGLSTSFNLLCSIFAAIFMGLQRFAVPTALGLLNRILFIAVVLITVFLHKGLAAMGAAVAIVNVTTGVMHFVAWRVLAEHVRLSLRRLDYAVVRKMVTYCSGLAVWSMAMLCISGLDVTLVARYDFTQTALYSIAATPTNFMIAIMGAVLAPLMPTTSALSVHRTPHQMGDLLTRATRYAATLLLLSGLPLLVAGYWVLRMWVGAAYAPQIFLYMRVLVVANIVRNLCAPYASMLVATDTQRVAIAGAIAEAASNLGCSIYFARHFGAIGVAYGTLIGAFVGVGVHFGWNMRSTYSQFSVSRLRIFWTGMGQPALLALPSLLILPRWWVTGRPQLGVTGWMAWAGSTLLLGWFVSLDASGRRQITVAVQQWRRPALR